MYKLFVVGRQFMLVMILKGQRHNVIFTVVDSKRVLFHGMRMSIRVSYTEHIFGSIGGSSRLIFFQERNSHFKPSVGQTAQLFPAYKIYSTSFWSYSFLSFRREPISFCNYLIIEQLVIVLVHKELLTYKQLFYQSHRFLRFFFSNIIQKHQ